MRQISYVFALLIVAACKTSTTAVNSSSDNQREKDPPLRAVVTERSVATGEPQKNSAVAIILNNTLGGDEGMYISKQMDAQALDIGKEGLTGGKILRVGEGIKITYDGGVMFKKNSSTLTESSKKDLRRIAQAVTQHNNTRLVIEGHTDGSGSEKDNLMLSQARAKAVADFFSSEKIDPDKIAVIGYGEQQPLFSNATEEGRRQNRRVEIVIIADEALRAAAKKGP